MSIAIDLAGRTAWVTGGGSGIGAETVSTLLRAGARVVSLDRSHGSGPITRPLSDGPWQAHVDVADHASVEAVATRLLEADLVPDILVNGAGITRDAPVWKLGVEDWASVIDVNLTGAFLMTRAVAPLMRERRQGTIINIASINGLRGKFGQANYAASKGGLIAFTRAVARELGARGIRANAVAPGMIETPMTASLPAEIRAQAEREAALGRLGHPSDVAAAVLFLASPLAAHITGHVLIVDGGQLA